MIAFASGYEEVFPKEVRPLVGSTSGALLAQQTAANLHAGPGDFVTVKRIACLLFRCRLLALWICLTQTHFFRVSVYPHKRLRRPRRTTYSSFRKPSGTGFLMSRRLFAPTRHEYSSMSASRKINCRQARRRLISVFRNQLRIWKRRSPVKPWSRIILGRGLRRCGAIHFTQRSFSFFSASLDWVLLFS